MASGLFDKHLISHISSCFDYQLNEAMNLFKSMSSSSKIEAIQHWNHVSNQFQLHIEKVADEWIDQDGSDPAKAGLHTGNTCTSDTYESLWLQNNMPSYDKQPSLYEHSIDDRANDTLESDRIDLFSSLEVPIKCEPQEAELICTSTSEPMSKTVLDPSVDPHLLSQTILMNSDQSVWKQPEVYLQTPNSTPTDTELGSDFYHHKVSEELAFDTSTAGAVATQSQVEAPNKRIESPQGTLLEETIEVATEYVYPGEQKYSLQEVCIPANANQVAPVPVHLSSPTDQVYLSQDIHSVQILTNDIKLFPGLSNFYTVYDQQFEVIPSDVDGDRQTQTIKGETTCLICGKTGFSTKSNLRRHIQSHEKRFPCGICSKAYTEKKALEIHTRTHTGERPYKCEICGREFTQEIVLKNHITTHTGERKFACTMCPKMFRQQSQLTTHIWRHEGIKRVSCTECDAKFTTKDELAKHFRKHTGERPFACPNCEKKYKRKGDLNRHLGIQGQKVGNNSNSCAGFCPSYKSSSSASSNVMNQY